MHALRHVHELLVPGGTLVDLHPVTEEQVETSAGAFIGTIEEPGFLSVELPNTERRLQEAIRDGLYELEAEVEFDFLQHFDATEELLEAKADLLGRLPALVRAIRAVPPPLVAREHCVLRRLRVR